MPRSLQVRSAAIVTLVLVIVVEVALVGIVVLICLVLFERSLLSSLLRLSVVFHRRAHWLVVVIESAALFCLIQCLLDDGPLGEICHS